MLHHAGPMLEIASKFMDRPSLNNEIYEDIL